MFLELGGSILNVPRTYNTRATRNFSGIRVFSKLWRDLRGETAIGRAVMALGVIVATIALVSCGGAREGPQPTTIVPPPTVPLKKTPKPKPPPPPPGVALPWPTYGANNARLRAVDVPGLRPPFRRLWTFHGRGLLEFPPALGYGSLFEEAFHGRLSSIDPATGRTRWSYESHRCGWSTPAVADHLLFATFIGNYECKATRSGGWLYAFDPQTGRIRWQRPLGPSESSPLVEGDNLYVADQYGYVYDFDARTGRLRWRYSTGTAIKASPTLAYGRIYIGNYGGEMLALDARSGRLVWSSSGHGSFYSTASVNAGHVYVGSLDDRVYAFSAKNGAVLWSYGTGSYVYASPAVWHGLVLVGSYDGTFYAIAGGTGSLRWSYHAGARISGAASVVDGIVYFSSFDHRSYGLIADNGHLRLEWPDGEYSPVVAGNGRLYFVGLGQIYALSPR
jgi:outer membrane protein assembly factor BamB